MILAVSSLRVPAARQEALEAAFRARQKRVDGHPGFRRLQLVKQKGDDEYLLMLLWDDMQSFRDYVKSSDFDHAHADLDGDVKPGPLRIFDLLLDSDRGE